MRNVLVDLMQTKKYSLYNCMLPCMFARLLTKMLYGYDDS